MTTDTVRLRFAPSPTGYFHVGGARTALFDWLFARHNGGKFILRIEDTDRTRYEPDALPDLLESLRWLGLDWDEGPEVGGDYGPYYQSDRLPLYRQYADQLVQQERAYRCYCSPERLEALRATQRDAGEGMGYDRHCRHLTQKQIADYQAQGIVPVVRLAAPLEGTTSFEDLLRGRITFDNHELSDPVLLKSDGFPTYHLAVVVDDYLMEITHVTRGEEWLSSVPNHVLLYNAFGWQMPVQVHFPTILDPSGHGKLSKRKKKAPGDREQYTYVHEFREAGYLPEALFNYMALVGWSYDGQTEFLSRDQLVRAFTLERINTSPAAFSYDKLDHMNATYLRGLGDNDLAGRLLQALRRRGLEPDFFTLLRLVPLIKERIKTLNEAWEWIDFVWATALDYDPALLIQKKMDAAGTLQALEAAASSLAALERFDEATLEETLRALSEELGLKVGQLLGVIRVACTGKAVAPPLFGSLSVLGQAETVRRLQQAEGLLP
jgi:glutamyl-tRNA synthetase